MILYLSPLLYAGLIILPALSVGFPASPEQWTRALESLLFFILFFFVWRLILRLLDRHFSKRAADSETGSSKTALFVFGFLLSFACLLFVIQLLRMLLSSEAFAAALVLLPLGGIKMQLERKGYLAASVVAGLAIYTVCGLVCFMLLVPIFVWQSLFISLFAASSISGYEAARLLARVDRAAPKKGKKKAPASPAKRLILTSRVLFPLPACWIGALFYLQQISLFFLIVFAPIVLLPRILPQADSGESFDLPQRFEQQAAAYFLLGPTLFALARILTAL